jgi:flagellar biosynthetic protein FliQ
MNQADVIDIATKAVWVTLEVSLPILITALVVGLVVAIAMALTQIQEMTLTFIPKILAVVAVLAIAGPWMLSTLMTFTINLFHSIPQMVNGG